ncbi:hypothetical protein G4B88_001096 [Cannabis sativa]|uniref:Uncharacterized protein n=1 Tax=Cannabis sativa TaxID=3483 RepID=A0A7J6E0T0_CANSA|nr:hypothetical protein G4B88_001096 [Cannabis sativa]
MHIKYGQRKLQYPVQHNNIQVGKDSKARKIFPSIDFSVTNFRTTLLVEKQFSGGRALNNFIQLHSSDQSQSEIYSQDGKIVTIIEPASLQEVLFESLSQKNQCWGKFCAPWSPCQPGCVCVGAVGTGACVGPPK